MFKAFTWSTVLADYYSRGNPNWSDTTMTAWIESVLATYDELLAAYPPPEGSEIVRKEGESIGVGAAAYYSPSYDAAWWEGAMALHASWNNAVEDWRVDPQGYYCVHPNYWIGERLTLIANGVTVECTIGDMVAIPHRVSWRSNWVVELGWDTFKALGLDKNNEVEVFYLDLDPTDDHITPTPEPTVPETPTPGTPEPTITPPDQHGVQVPVRQGDDPTAPVETPEPPAAEPTAEPSAPVPDEPTVPEPAPSGTPTPLPPEESESGN
jgi:hypothetical protein